MRLTKEHKAAFVKAVMLDVPQVDYDSQFEKLIEEDMLAVIPKPALALLYDKKLRYPLLDGNSSYRPSATTVDGSHVSAWDTGLGSVAVFSGYQPSAECLLKMEALVIANVRQRKAREDLKISVYGAINGCTTRKAALTALPEFEKYLPAETDIGMNRMVPAIANLAAELMQAGWPKGAATGAA